MKNQVSPWLLPRLGTGHWGINSRKRSRNRSYQVSRGCLWMYGWMYVVLDTVPTQDIDFGYLLSNVSSKCVPFW